MEPLLCCLTNTCVPPAACRFIRERSGCISVFLRQAHHNLHAIITVHPSSSFTLQLEKAQERCQISWCNHRDAPMMGSQSIYCSMCHKPPPPCSASTTGTCGCCSMCLCSLWHFLAGLKTLHKLTQWAGSHCSLANKARGKTTCPRSGCEEKPTNTFHCCPLCCCSWGRDRLQVLNSNLFHLRPRFQVE